MAWNPRDGGIMRFDIFLAYASEDVTYAQALYEQLQGSCRVFMDRARLVPGRPWDEALLDAIESSRMIVFLLSERSQDSWYLKEEVARAVSLMDARPDGVKIVPVLLSDGPLPYGLQRVQAINAVGTGVEDIARKLLDSLSRDEPIASPRGAVWQEASAPPALFGRDREINVLLNLIQKRAGRNVIAIDGMGGIGKTALAKEVVRRISASGEFSHVVWQTAKTEAFDGSGIVRQISSPPITMERLLLAIANEGSFRQRLDEERSLAERTYLVRQLMEKERFLVVVDNLETIQGFRRLVSDLGSLFTGSQALLTSRYSLAEYDFVQPVSLGSLPADAGVALLRNELQERSPLKPLIMDDDYLKRIHRDTGGLPLAMKLIAGRIVSTAAPLGRLLEQLRNVDWRNPEDAYGQLYSFIFENVWDGLSESARSILVRMSGLPPVEPMPMAYVEVISEQDTPVFDRAMAELVRSSMVELSEDRRSRCSLHPLTHHFVTRRAEDG